MRRQRLSPAELHAWVGPLQAATSLETLEAAWHALLQRPGYWDLPAPADRALHAVLEHCGWRVVEADEHGAMIPRIVRTPARFRGTYRGQRFTSGPWGNGAGYRWAKQALIGWVQRVGGLPTRQQAEKIVDWVLVGMPPRALAVRRHMSERASAPAYEGDEHDRS